MEKVRFEGKEIELQNMVIIIPPLNFQILRKQNGLKKIQSIIKGFKAIQSAEGEFNLSDETLADVAELVWLAARRNYPELTLDQIEEGLDLENVMKIIPVLVMQNPVNKLVQEGKNE